MPRNMSFSMTTPQIRARTKTVTSQDGGRLSGETVCPDPEDNQRMLAYTERHSAECMDHPYYRYGFEHPVADPWQEHDKLPWKEIMGVPL